MVGNISVGDEDARANDVLGRVYEYFLGQFAGAEGKKGGEFYTPRCVVRLLVEMLEPYSRPRLRPLLRFLPGCSCNPSSSSMRTPPATETAARLAATSQSTAKSRTTRHGVSPG